MSLNIVSDPEINTIYVVKKTNYLDGLKPQTRMSICTSFPWECLFQELGKAGLASTSVTVWLQPQGVELLPPAKQGKVTYVNKTTRRQSNIIEDMKFVEYLFLRKRA